MQNFNRRKMARLPTAVLFAGFTEGSLPNDKEMALTRKEKNLEIPELFPLGGDGGIGEGLWPERNFRAFSETAAKAA